MIAEPVAASTGVPRFDIRMVVAIAPTDRKALVCLFAGHVYPGCVSMTRHCVAVMRGYLNTTLAVTRVRQG